MSTTNPYQSAQSPCGMKGTPANRRRTCANVCGVVLFNVALNARSAVQHWPELTVVHYLIGALLWLALPLLAVLLMWRGKVIGRWLLIGLFGVRGIGEVLFLAPVVVGHPAMLFDGPFPFYAVQALFYLAATAWLVFSPSVRALCVASCANQTRD